MTTTLTAHVSQYVRSASIVLSSISVFSDLSLLTQTEILELIVSDLSPVSNVRVVTSVISHQSTTVLNQRKADLK